ncbi:Ribosomal RNA processing protein [Penicillium bovifimosum]|uniref:Ribosomal RNA processing protein n=1 Tax=Penicillium bovifimosum TaxID=126998 RepID=A0A9W9L422_9EURO|nr:Ribosomal RNA processing protein [Penicillium bovifimosum]KAJ5135209.1 Ribosomal RNA processing protein [Penicillium bovifimosum]
MDGQKTPFVRELGSSERKVRDKALNSLTQFVRSRTDLTLVDLLKLWKGLFYCFYHSDRPLTQQALARALSYTLVPSLPHQTLHRFLRAFWITIGRDFHALDRIRLDKYLMLIRFYVGVAFEVLLKNESAKSDGKKRKRDDAAKGRGKKLKKQDEDETEAADEKEEEEGDDLEAKYPDLAAYIAIIEEGPLCPLNYDEDQDTEEGDPNYVPMPHGPDGLRYHLIDIWIDELEKVLEFEEVETEGEETKRKIKGDVPMELILRPLEKLRAESAYKPVRTRAAEALQDERLFEWGVRTREVEEEDEDEEEWGGFE